MRMVGQQCWPSSQRQRGAASGGCVVFLLFLLFELNTRGTWTRCHAPPKPSPLATLDWNVPQPPLIWPNADLFGFVGCHRTRYSYARREPFLVHVGGQKSGTTSTFAALRELPRGFLFHPTAKELDLFVGVDHIDQATLETYVMSFRSGDPACLDAGGPPKAVIKEKNRGKCYCVDISPNYVSDQQSPRLICNSLVNAKVILTLREPAARALSGFGHTFSHNRTKLKIEDYFQFILNKPEGEEFGMHMIGRGRYLEQLKEVLRYHRPTNVFVYQSELLFKDPGLYFKRYFKFLGYRTANLKPPSSLPRENSQSSTTYAANEEASIERVRVKLQYYYCEQNRELAELLARLAAVAPDNVFFEPELWNNDNCDLSLEP